jgi:NitT/TauT family transport system substrate-binding protein
MKHKAILILIGLVALALLAAGCGGQAPAPARPADKPAKTVAIGMLKLTSSAPIFIGIEKGFFKEAGINLDVQWFDAAHPIVVATASNKVAVGATGITASLFNLVAGGQHLAIVADKGREQKGYSSSAVMVRTDLWDKGVRRIEDLRGKRIGITQTGSTFHYMIGRLLEARGLALADVELVPLGKLSSLMASLQGGQIDAVILNEPNLGKVAAAGYGKVVAQVGDIIDYQTSTLFFSPAFLKDRAAAVAFLKGYIKATRYYYDAALVIKDGKAAPGANYDEVIAIIAKYTGAPVADIKSGLPYMDRDGRLLAGDIQTQIDWYAAHKMIEKPVKAAQVVDTALWEEAREQVK